MNRLSLKVAALAVLVGCLGTASQALGQTGYNRPVTSGLSRPTTSPYLNLLRSGSSALNYYNLVRPEFEFRNAYQGLQGQLTQQQNVVRELSEEGLPVTGHATLFQNYSHYYPSSRGVGTTITQAQAPQTRGRPSAASNVRP